MADPAPWQWLRRAPRSGCALAALVGLLAMTSAGCSHLALARRTVSQGSTLTDIQNQQVLDNLAMFACNPNAMAWHVKVTGGVVQVADAGQGLIGTNLGGPRVLSSNVNVARNVLGQWNVDPVNDPDEIGLLQIAYRKAIDPLDAEGAIRREAYQKVCELASDFHITLSRAVAFDVLDSMRHDADVPKQARLDRLAGELGRLYRQIDELALTAEPYDPARNMVQGVAVPPKADFLREEVVRLLHEVCHSSIEQVQAFHRPGRNVGLVEQAADKIEALLALVEEHPGGEPNPFSIPWVHKGCKEDVPPCVCLVGHYCDCGCDCYAWIEPQDAGKFRDFVLIVLGLVPPDAQDMVTGPTGLGAANSPNF